MAPEQLEGRDLDGAADQYALAAIAFRALTGRLPFPRDSEVALISAHLKDPPPSATELRPELPAAVDAVIARGMAKTPADRYASCAAFIADLRTALGQTAPTPVGWARRRNVDRRVWVALAISGTLAAFALVTWFIDVNGAGDVSGAGPTPPSATASLAAAIAPAAGDADAGGHEGSIPRRGRGRVADAAPRVSWSSV